MEQLFSFVSSWFACCWPAAENEHIEQSVRCYRVQEQCREILSIVSEEEPRAKCLFCKGEILGGRTHVRASCGHESTLCAVCAVGAPPYLTVTPCSECLLNSYQCCCCCCG